MFSSLLLSLVITLVPSIQNFLTRTLSQDAVLIIVAIGFIFPALSLFLLIGFSLRMFNLKFDSKARVYSLSKMSENDF